MFIEKNGSLFPEQIVGTRTQLKPGQVYDIYLDDEKPLHGADTVSLIPTDPLRLEEDLIFTDEEMCDIERIIKYNAQRKERNLGIVIHGLPGCGKTITANYIATLTKLPIVKVNEPIPCVCLDRIASAADENGVLFLFDESEKKNESSGSSFDFRSRAFLTFLSGENSTAKKMCIFCANSQEEFPAEVKSRPSRVRYWIKKEGEKHTFVKVILRKEGFKEEDIEPIYQFIIENFKVILKDTVKSFAEELRIFWPALPIEVIASKMNIEFKNDLKFKDAKVERKLSQSDSVGQLISNIQKETGQNREDIAKSIQSLFRRKRDTMDKLYRQIGYVPEDEEDVGEEGDYTWIDKITAA